MPWFKIDDGFWSHPKILELSDEAIALWVRAGSYCAGHLTDGEVKRSTLRLLAATNDAATELVLAGLWDYDGKATWTFHDWEHYQPSREQVLAEREAAAERMRRVRANRKANVQPNDDGTSGARSATPTRPDPTRPPPSNEGGPPPRFCSKHPNGTEQSCRPCGTARKRLEDWEKAEKNKPSPEIRRDRECSKHPGWPDTAKTPCQKCRDIAAEEGTTQ